MSQSDITDQGKIFKSDINILHHRIITRKIYICLVLQRCCQSEFHLREETEASELSATIDIT